jgi:hypothetical protein
MVILVSDHEACNFYYRGNHFMFTGQSMYMHVPGNYAPVSSLDRNHSKGFSYEAMELLAGLLAKQHPVSITWQIFSHQCLTKTYT